MTFKGKTALVTGGSSGIGYEIARKFVAQGAKVIIASRDEKKGQKAAKELGAVFVKCDVTNEAEVRRLLSGLKKLDILVNNVGVYEEGDLALSTLEHWEKLMAVNLRSVFLCTKYAFPLLKKSRGTIINIGSAHGLKAEEGSGAYCTAKAGVIMLTKVHALEGARHHVRVNCVCPGPIDTPMLHKSVPDAGELQEWVSEVVPMGRVGSVEEVANIVLFLASEQASYITGAVLNVDGGMSAK